MSIWDLICPLCGGAKSQRSKRCRDCFTSRKRKKIKRSKCPMCKKFKSAKSEFCSSCRTKIRAEKPASLGIPTTVELHNGVTVYARSKVEASWAEIFGNAGCLETFHEDTYLYYNTKDGFSKRYLPDFRIETPGGRIYCEIKHNEENCLNDPRPSASVKFDPNLKILCLGGKPTDKMGFTVRLISSSGEKIYKNISLVQLSALLDCDLTQEG